MGKFFKIDIFESDLINSVWAINSLNEPPNKERNSLVFASINKQSGCGIISKSVVSSEFWNNSYWNNIVPLLATISLVILLIKWPSITITILLDFK